MLDLDIALWSGGKFRSRELTIPHPRLARRSFVLQPLSAIAAGWRIGPLSIVVTLASLYPASTVLLARWILHEHLSRAQIAGIICALLAVGLIVSQGAA